MKFKLPEGTFPPLKLSPQETETLALEAQRVVLETVGEFDDLVANNRKLPHDQWQFIKTKENLAAYRTRKGYDTSKKRRDGGRAAWSPSWFPQAPHLVSGSMYPREEALERMRKEAKASVDSQTAILGYQSSPSPLFNGSYRDRLASVLGDSALEANKPPHTPVVVVTGMYPGTVEDAALGNLADTEVLWKLRSAFIDDERDDYKILATLLRPTKEDPFRFLDVKWSTKKFAWLTTQRDILYVESAGVLRDPHTGKITTGYNLLHSVEIPRIPELHRFDVIRTKLSICFLTRQYDAHTVELYCRGFSAPGGGMIGTVATSLYADSMMLSANVIACAYGKKLMWLMQQRRVENVQYTTKTVETATHCHSCTKSFKGISGFMRTSTACQCCRRIVCNKCHVDMKLVVDITASEVTQRSVPFCLQCVLEARKLSALEIATVMAPAADTSNSRSNRSSKNRFSRYRQR